MTRLDRRRAAQIAIMGQLLDAERPRGIVETVERLFRVQMDPTAVVARTEQLVLWSRLGAYDKADLDRLMWRERTLFEYWAFIVPMSDLHLYRPTMRRVLIRDTSRARYIRRWLHDNQSFRRGVVRQLARRGPLRSRDIADESSVGYTSGGWNDGRNVTRMLDILWATGEIAIVGREGTERVWGVAKGWYARPRRATPREIARAVLTRSLAAKGIARINEFGFHFDGRPDGWDRALAELMRERMIVAVEIEGLRGTFYAYAPLLERRFRGRTAILSPFDRLIHDRRRTAELFDFDYRLEIYVPPAQRRWGYYVLPVLRGDRLVARFDARAERDTSTLRVPALYAERAATADDARATAREVRRLARWLGLRNVAYERVPRGWRSALS